MNAIKFTLDILFWGLTLLSAGALCEITYELAHKAAKGQLQFVELGKWNRALTNESAHLKRGGKNKP
jgi:hypothetical protein